MCNKQSERLFWTRREAHFLLMRSLNNKKNIAPLTLNFRPDLSWSIAQSIFKIATLKKCAWTHLVFRPENCICYLKNCIGLKLTKTPAPCAALRRVYDRALCLFWPNFGSANAMSLGRGYLFIWPMTDRGREFCKPVWNTNFIWCR